MGIDVVNNILLIPTGPSGVGKDTVIRVFQERNPSFRFIVTCTSRKIRPGEVDGRDYNFFGLDDFLTRKKRGEFAEVCEYRPNEWKGTLRRDLEDEGKNLIWRVDPSMAGRAKDFFKENGMNDIVPRILTVYIGIESISELFQRKRIRDGENFCRKEFDTNLRRDWETWRQYKYDQVIINREGQIEQTVKELEKIVCNKFTNCSY
jgi:guanylate kinase